MTPTINLDSYAQLLTQYKPRVILTAEENEAAISMAYKLEHQSQRTPEEDALLDLLVTLIKKFEDEQYPIPQITPLSTLKYLMEESGVKQKDLIGILGSRGVVSEVVNGKRSISKTQAKAIAEFFNVDVSLFIA
jgi:HTH-type transcriptional regulator / antitoxin HigA